MKTSVNFEFATPNPLIQKVEVGQYYRNFNDIYIVAQCGYERYCLISLGSGNRWSNPTGNIENIFDGFREEFTLVNKADVTVS